jgi:hydrogenase nickel incorporation protein HypA/HybF
VHELSAATAIVKTILSASEDRMVRRIRSVDLKIGQLTLLSPEQLEFCFQIASKGTIAEGAELNMERSPAVLECESCGSSFPWAPPEDDPANHLVLPILQCECGATKVRVVSGRELEVVSINVEKAEPAPPG